jgi:hypothetical protein
MNPRVGLRERPPVSGAVLLRRIQARGFQVRSEEEAARLGPWICFTPMLQTLMFGLSTITGSAPAFVGLAALLVVGLLTGWHPFDWFYHGVIRPLEKSPPLPKTPVRRRFVFALGIAWCLVTARAFSTGHTTLANALGVVMTASTGLLAFTHICIPSQVMAWMKERTQRGGPSRAGS